MQRWGRLKAAFRAKPGLKIGRQKLSLVHMSINTNTWETGQEIANLRLAQAMQQEEEMPMRKDGKKSITDWRL